MNSSSLSASELPALGFLADVSAEQRSFLACFGRFLRPENGEVLIAEGDEQDALYVILTGILHIVATSVERPLLLAKLGEGDSMGEINLFDPAVASATAIARSGGLVWTLSRQELDAFLEADPVAGVAVLRSLLRQTSQRIRTMNAKLATAEERTSFHEFFNSGQE